jgi:RHS repeat-associated protein
MHKKNTDQLYYFHLDVMGSLVAITNESGILLESRNYDPWGKPRNPQTLTYALSNPFGGSSYSYTLRGYTFHEHYEMFDLINMNGRLYDNQIGQFINADPILADNENLQNYNRYSYVMNNPLKYTDPSGYVYRGGSGAGTYGSGTSLEEISFNSIETEKFDKGIQERQDEMRRQEFAFLLSSGAGPINPALLNGYILPEFSTAPPKAKQSGTNFSWAQSLRQDGNYMPYYQMGQNNKNVLSGPSTMDYFNNGFLGGVSTLYGGTEYSFKWTSKELSRKLSYNLSKLELMPKSGTIYQAWKKSSNSASTWGTRVGYFGAALSTYDYINNFDKATVGKHTNYWLSTTLFALSIFPAIAPIFAPIGFIYGASQFGTFIGTGKSIEENWIDP